MQLDKIVFPKWLHLCHLNMIVKVGLDCKSPASKGTDVPLHYRNTTNLSLKHTFCTDN